MKIIIDDKIPYIKGQAEQLGETVYLPGNKISADDVHDADVLIVRTRTTCNEGLLANSSVKFIATATIGYDHLDLDYLQRKQIAWTNCPGCNANSVAQYVACSLLLLEKEGKLNLKETTVGIVGVGNVGQSVQKLLETMGCRVLLNDPPRAERDPDFPHTEMSVLQKECDVITFHTPLTTTGNHATYHLVDDNFFAQLSRTPVFINAGRGEVVSTEALLRAIDAKQIRAAIIDTWENEPHINLELLQKVYIGTPHIAGYSADGKANGTRMSLQAVARYFGKDITFDVQAPHLPPDFCYDPQHRCSDDARLRLYNPLCDSDLLKCNPDLFEQIRGDYPLRREKATDNS
ncbi:MAG: 4-phosphoerythronate dehydrogenase [Bacteroidaceae bacterium]|nr:4-phosphoerythronate dehydrogenase [Bacteroidaceae bacterium]